jgi:uncharacterized protein YjbJ (UPF0337 family)
MKTMIMKGEWNIIKGKLKQRYSDLTEDDLKYEEGKEDELFGRLQKAFGESEEHVRKLVEHIADEGTDLRMPRDLDFERLA